MSRGTWDPPLSQPVLPGDARTAYERYLNSGETLSLQKNPVDVTGTRGTPVEVLGRLIHRVENQELWDVRNELTAKTQAEG